MPFLALLNWRMWVVIIIALVLAASHWKAYHMGAASVKAKWAAEKLEVARQSAKLIEANIAKTNTLQDRADTIRRTKDAEIQRIRDERDAALVSLRNRPDRPSDADMPKGASAGPACTGRSLFHEDADFLVRESARADEQRLQLTQCQAAYESARQVINKE